MIPMSAVLYNTFGQPSCFVAGENPSNFVRRRIEIGVRSNDLIEVTRGLQPDDMVVSIGAQLLAGEESRGELSLGEDD
jgi:multidrug efflux pump subunit AcrA (membrane-fusion protein)